MNEWWSRFGDVLAVELYQTASRTVTVSTVAGAMLMLVMALWISRMAQRAITRVLSLGRLGDPGRVALVRRLVHYGIVSVATLTVLQALGVNLSTVFAAGAVTAVAVGFAAQAVFENLIAGLLLLGDGSLKPGDVLEVEGKVVRVIDLGFRATIVRTLNDEDLLLPNATLVRGTVTNYTYQDSSYRLRTRVGVTYGSDMKAVREVLRATAAATEWRSQAEEPRILMLEFGDSAVIWDVSVWIEDPWRAQQFRSQLNEAIWWALKEAGITIAFPQLDIHLDDSVQSALARRDEA